MVRPSEVRRQDSFREKRTIDWLVKNFLTQWELKRKTNEENLTLFRFLVDDQSLSWPMVRRVILFAIYYCKVRVRLWGPHLTMSIRVKSLLLLHTNHWLHKLLTTQVNNYIGHQALFEKTITQVVNHKSHQGIDWENNHTSCCYHQIANNNYVLMIITYPCSPQIAVTCRVEELALS